MRRVGGGFQHLHHAEACCQGCTILRCAHETDVIIDISSSFMVLACPVAPTERPSRVRSRSSLRLPEKRSVSIIMTYYESSLDPILLLSCQVMCEPLF
jgi:hypothetical protein